jgi:hypothetical protein
MTCSTCPLPARYKGPPPECQNCRRRRRYREEPDFRKKANEASVAATRRKRQREAQELSRLRAYKAAVEAVIEDWEGQRHARDYATELRFALKEN